MTKKRKSTLKPLILKILNSRNGSVVVVRVPAGTSTGDAWAAHNWARNLAKKISRVQP